MHSSLAQGFNPYLVDAAINGLHKCVQKLIDLGANVNAVSEVNKPVYQSIKLRTSDVIHYSIT